MGELLTQDAHCAWLLPASRTIEGAAIPTAQHAKKVLGAISKNADIKNAGHPENPVLGVVLSAGLLSNQ